MQIGAVNSVNFKGYEPYELSDDDFKVNACAVEPDRFVRADEPENKTVEAKDVKNPIETIASVAVAIGSIYLLGVKVARLTQKGVSKISKDIIPNSFDSATKKVDQLLKSASENLVKSADDTKFGKVKKLASEVIDYAEKNAKKAYKMLSKVTEDGVEKSSPAKAFERVAGIASVAAVTPGILTKDRNNDGVSDIVQRSENAYFNASKNVDEAESGVGKILDIVTEVLA